MLAGQEARGVSPGPAGEISSTRDSRFDTFGR